MSRNRIKPAYFKKRTLGWLVVSFTLVAPLSSMAEVFALPANGSDLIGEIQYTKAKHEDTLIDIAREFSVGQDEIVMANPTVDRWLPGDGKDVLVPRQFILPDAPHSGVVINIPEMRLYYYPAQPKTKATQVITYPVSIGRMDWRTPLGATKIAQKVKDPVWRPPETIKEEHARDGDILPDVVPAGPLNPLGRFALRLGVPGYLIHGTGIDKAYGIGMRVTHGCIRMYPEDIERLYPLVNVGTPVHLVNQPVKLGWSDGTLYMEVHQPLDEDRMTYEQLLDSAMDMIEKKTARQQVVLDGAALKQALQQPSGVPVAISKSPDPIPEPTQALGGT
ncbi:L,D-transpeptidase family protein [Methylocaldum sp.]|uniref:L,D-transpeptidase family protein n=1 Tax=Methylocaldum sp. TaxID=1969727 RepID=UPI002D4EBE0B|nr:L,D-transpeptidase family protein [Methylocaldum sp.]HYE34005.1 L,D-transpeptidase family protein [Methylocaldum sp.]